MVQAFLKEKKVGEIAEGEFPYNVIAIDAETQEELDAKKADYLANGYEESSADEYEQETGSTVSEEGTITPEAEQPAEEVSEEEVAVQ